MKENYSNKCEQILNEIKEKKNYYYTAVVVLVVAM